MCGCYLGKPCNVALFHHLFPHNACFQKLPIIPEVSWHNRHKPSAQWVVVYQLHTVYNNTSIDFMFCCRVYNISNIFTLALVLCKVRIYKFEAWAVKSSKIEFTLCCGALQPDITIFTNSRQGGTELVSNKNRLVVYCGEWIEPVFQSGFCLDSKLECLGNRLTNVAM